MNRSKKAILATSATLLLGALVGTGLWASGGWDWQAVERTGWLASIGAFALPITGVWAWALTKLPPEPDPTPPVQPPLPNNPATTPTQARAPEEDQEPARPTTYNGPHIEIHDNKDVGTIIGQQNNHHSTGQNPGKNPKQ